MADLVADLRAPTPSAAAERAVPDAAQMEQALRSIDRQMISAARGALAEQAGWWNPSSGASNTRRRTRWAWQSTCARWFGTCRPASSGAVPQTVRASRTWPPGSPR
ncbi:MAG: hypothetical protein IPI33_00485 [Dehalococcoidia bacterium]|nr:hypothetical protein [Dehalococcoidia bacterium]